MKIKSYDESYSVKPKQKKGRIVVFDSGFTIKPKPKGLVVGKIRLNKVIKSDSKFGISITRQVFSRMLKQFD